MGCRELNISDCFIFSTEKDHSAAHFEYSPFGKIISDSGSMPEKFAFHFDLCLVLDDAIKKALEAKFKAGASSFPKDIKDKFVKSPKALDSTKERYMGSNWTLSDNCQTFTLSMIGKGIRNLSNDKNATLRSKKQARVLLSLIFTSTFLNMTPDSFTKKLESMASEYDWIEEVKANNTQSDKEENSCCKKSSS